MDNPGTEWVLKQEREDSLSETFKDLDTVLYAVETLGYLSAKYASSKVQGCSPPEVARPLLRLMAAVHRRQKELTQHDTDT